MSRRARCGLTLIELVLTISLVGIIGIPTGLLLGEHIRAAMTTRDSTLATQLARYQVEQLDSLVINGIGDFFALTNASFPNYLGYPYDVTRTVTCLTDPLSNCSSVDPTIQAMKKIEVSVTRSNSTERLARLITYRTKHVLFGS